jgi:hypothetical protein
MLAVEVVAIDTMISPSQHEDDTMPFTQFYAPQTKIWEDRTNISQRVFEAIFNGL